MTEETQQFLTLLFGDPVIAGEDLSIVIWSAPSKRATFYQDCEKAAERAVELSEKKENVYVGMGLQEMPKTKRRTSRGKAKDVKGIVCFWADIDIDDKHVPDEKSALALANEIGVHPSITIHSGHGLQCFWLLDQPWIFSDDDEQKHAANLTSGWVETLQGLATKHGWHIDPVGDLSRVMRIPGTVNWKNPEEPLALKILNE